MTVIRAPAGLRKRGSRQARFGRALSRFFLFDGELLQEYEELLIEGSEQGRQIKESIEQVLGVPALINGRAELGAILKTATKRQGQEMAHVQGLERQADQIDLYTSRLDGYERDKKNLQDRLVQTRQVREKLEDELDAAAQIIAQKAALDSARTTRQVHMEARDRKQNERKELLTKAWIDMLGPKLDLKRDQLRAHQKSLTDSIKERATLGLHAIGSAVL
jgi:DNA sulfur modification protein DndD